MVKLDFALHSLFIYYRKRFWMGVMSPIGTSYVLENPLHVIPICSSWQHSFCFHFQICVNCMITTAWFMCQWFSFGGLCKLPIVIFILFCHKLESALQVHIIKKKKYKSKTHTFTQNMQTSKRCLRIFVAFVMRRSAHKNEWATLYLTLRNIV